MQTWPHAKPAEGNPLPARVQAAFRLGQAETDFPQLLDHRFPQRPKPFLRFTKNQEVVGIAQVGTMGLAFGDRMVPIASK